MSLVATTLHDGSTTFYVVDFIHANFFWIFFWLGLLLLFLIIAVHKSAFVVIKPLPVCHIIISCFANVVHAAGHGQALLTRYFYPASHCPFPEEALFVEYCPTPRDSPRAYSFHCSHPISQGIEGTCPASHAQGAAQIAMLLA